MKPDDISGLLQPQKVDSPFRQGRLLTFNPATGANTVLVGGSVLTNIPLLIEGGAFNLQGDDVLGAGNGNVVILMKMKSAWAILGRILVPGDPNIINSGDVTQRGQLGTSNFAVTTGFTSPLNLTSIVPSWANKAVVSSIATATVVGTVANQMQLEIVTSCSSPASSVGSAFFTSPIVATIGSPGFMGNQTIADTQLLAVSGGATITIQIGILVAIAVATNAGTGCSLVTTINYQKV